MSSDITPDTSRAALEALAARLEAIDHMSVEDCFLQSPLYAHAAATLRALASRAEPPADVAGLVAMAEAMSDPDNAAAVSYTAWAPLMRRLAAALTAQAERIAVIEHDTAIKLVIDVEGADQDGPMVGWEYTATGMRFTIRGALAVAFTKQAERIKELESSK